MGEFLEDLRFTFPGRLESAPGESQLGLEVDPCQIVELLPLNEDSSLEITSPRERHLVRSRGPRGQVVYARPLWRRNKTEAQQSPSYVLQDGRHESATRASTSER